MSDAAETFSATVHVFLVSALVSIALALSVGTIGMVQDIPALRVLSGILFIAAASCAALWIERAARERTQVS